MARPRAALALRLAAAALLLATGLGGGGGGGGVVGDPPRPRQRAPRPPDPRPPRDDAAALSRVKISRWKQRVRHRRLTRRVPAARAEVEDRGRRGTCLRLSLGSAGRRREGCAVDEDRVARLFAAGRSSAHHPAPFNHGMVGMTNPCLHVMAPTSSSEDEGGDRRTLVAVPVSRSLPSSSSGGAAADVESSWWPGTACFADDPPGAAERRAGGRSWSVVRLRRRLAGRGRGCYQAVRDAALRWEFDAGDAGIVCVSSASRRRRARAVAPSDEAGCYSIAPGYYRVEADPGSSANGNGPQGGPGRLAYEESDMFRPTRSDQVLQIWSGPGSRRLVTHASKPSGGPLRLLAMSPVGVVYDLVDQRGSDGATTYTSTAYATLRGHWLAGEERVTVALRDGGAVDVEILSYSRPSRSLPGRLVWPFVGGMQRRFFEQQLRALERVAARSAGAAPPSGMLPVPH